MQVARRSTRAGGALAEATLDALAADLTVPHARPLVDLERDDYADVEVEQLTTRYERFEPEPPEPPRARARTLRVRKPGRRWASQHVAAALAAIAIGFGLGAVAATLLL